MEPDIRWRQRFDNFDHAVALLREVYDRGVESLSDLEQQGAIQRFEMAFELAWKTLKDYLEHEGVVVIPASPRSVLKAAFAAGIVDDGQVWIDMMVHRNVLSHAYDDAVFKQVLSELQERYFLAFVQLHDFFQTKAPGTR